jgi:glycerophosphoryl diester phosphodiesterase
MLIMGHRGSAGTHPEHSLEGIRETIASGAHMLEIDVRATADGQLVLAHDSHLLLSHGKARAIRRLRLDVIQKLTSERPLLTLRDVLRECHGQLIVMIELKDFYSVEPLSRALSDMRQQHELSWDDVVLASFNPITLARLRHNHPSAGLSMLHAMNPFGFFAWQRAIGLSCVGFHRLHLNSFATEVARKSQLLTYAYTVNRPSAARKLHQEGIDGIVTDFPRKMIDKLQPTL